MLKGSAASGAVLSVKFGDSGGPLFYNLQRRQSRKEIACHRPVEIAGPIRGVRKILLEQLRELVGETNALADGFAAELNQPQEQTGRFAKQPKTGDLARPVEYNGPARLRAKHHYLMPTSKLLSKARTLWLLVFGAVAASIVAAPLLASHARPLSAAGIYLLFSPLCHQLPERSCQLWGHSLAVCHRCSGISLGLFAAALLPLERSAWLRSARRRRFWAMTALLLLLADAAAPYSGIWTNTPESRFGTGLLFGAMMASLAWPGLLELLSQYLPARTPRRS